VIWYLDVRKWSKYLLVLLLAAAFAGVTHEFGHSLAVRAHGRYPRFHWGDGGQVVPYDRAGHPVADRPPAERMITSAAGPLTNLLLAAAFTFLYLRRRESFLLFAAAMMNATFRFLMFVDGFNSDEGNISADLLSTVGNPVALMVPLTVWTACIIICCTLLKRQSFFAKTYWWIPVFFVACGVFVRVSFGVLALAFD
jgi:hypothetical protein